MIPCSDAGDGPQKEEKETRVDHTQYSAPLATAGALEVVAHQRTKAQLSTLLAAQERLIKQMTKESDAWIALQWKARLPLSDLEVAAREVMFKIARWVTELSTLRGQA